MFPYCFLLEVKEVSLTSFLFLSLSTGSKRSAFPLTEVAASEVSAVLKKFISKEVTSEAAILKLSCQPGCVYVSSFLPTRNWQEEEKPATDLVAILHMNLLFFLSNYPLYLITTVTVSSILPSWSLELVWFSQNNMPQKQP